MASTWPAGRSHQSVFAIPSAVGPQQECQRAGAGGGARGPSCCVLPPRCGGLPLGLGPSLHRLHLCSPGHAGCIMSAA